MAAFPVSVDFEHVDACLDAARLGTAAAWDKVLALPVSTGILAHAGCTASELCVLIEKALHGEQLPQGIPGYVARKALRVADPRFAEFVSNVRPSAQQTAESAADAAAAYLPRPWPERLAVRFAGFAFADAFSAGDPVINLGDFYFGVLQKARGDAETRAAKTLDLLRRVMAHELHHVGLGRLLHFPETLNAEWLLRLIISEGVGTLLLLPFTEDDSYYFTNWSRHSGRLQEYLAELPNVIAASRVRIPDESFKKWVMNVGAAYYVGAAMAQAIERALGKERLVETLTDVSAFYSTYEAAARNPGRA